MNKLKAIEYFVASVEEGSFARAARRLDISVPAVQKLVGALEGSLGVALLERGSRGVRLTPSGGEYLDRCRQLLTELDEVAKAERRLQGSSEKVSGMLAVAAHPQLAHAILLPALPRFHTLYPEVEVDFRTVNRLGDADATTADVLLLHGWPEVPPDYVHRKFGATASMIMAAPEYWAAHGVPAHPSELARHTCVPMRNPAGILLDLWEFTRDDEREQVTVHGWFSSNAREAVLDLVLRGHGVGRFSELTTREHVRAGRLVPTLLDWSVEGGPPVNLLFRGSARRSPRLRAFIAFAEQCLVEANPAHGRVAARSTQDRPAWHRSGYGRASATVRTRR